MMTSQDGTPVPGPYTFPVVVCWKPSTCSESRVGVLRHGIMTEGMRDGEDLRRSGCVTERKTLASVSQRYRCCGARLTTVAAASALVSREMGSGRGVMDGNERLWSLHCNERLWSLHCNDKIAWICCIVGPCLEESDG